VGSVKYLDEAAALGQGAMKHFDEAVAIAKGTEKVGNAWGSAGDLIDSATIIGSGGVTPVGRAFQKHAGNAQRAGAFIGEATGNATRNTEQGRIYLDKILNNQNSTYTVRNTIAYGDILDVRLPDGTGARWTADGKTFIGFLEKYTPKP
jgi:hypothetical protein